MTILFALGVLLVALETSTTTTTVAAFNVGVSTTRTASARTAWLATTTTPTTLLSQKTSVNPPLETVNKDDDDKDNAVVAAAGADYEIPEDAVIQIRPQAMMRLQELRKQQGADQIYLRMGVKSGGCSGMSYIMDFCKPEDVSEDDVVDKYDSAGVQCVVDPKSILYLYGLELDYSTELIGGGFKFSNPNAEESCGCGSSFGI
eukprot:CAMPEP_0198141358 /NCGR_PEP_ID=MMETSP1443-20131203/4377_1 /TAXON_ID=186043 /ORGANISM="Entomoneis sp., Strain CCMP2396" /LENGTH=202 /DNA_ID=CAMNT_0043804087 /DNA_START=141 /DNA_END=749 /DNA_ORIENTATION=+